MKTRFITFLILFLVFLTGCAQKDSADLTKLKSTLASQQLSISIQQTSINEMTTKITQLASLIEINLVDHIQPFLGEDYSLSYYDSARDVTVVTPTKINVQIEVSGQLPEYVFVDETDTSVDFYFHDDTITEFITGYSVYSKESLEELFSPFSGHDLGRGEALTGTILIWSDLNDEQTVLRNEFAGRKFTVIVNRD